MGIKFGERVGHGGWLIGPKLIDPKLTRLVHLLSELCELFFIYGAETFPLTTIDISVTSSLFDYMCQKWQLLCLTEYVNS